MLWAGQRATDLEHSSDVFCRATDGNGGIVKVLYSGQNRGQQTLIMTVLHSAAQQTGTGAMKVLGAGQRGTDLYDEAQQQ